MDGTQRAKGISRRHFFGYAAGLAGAGILAGTIGCKKSDSDNRIFLGSGDIGLMNYIYAVEQLQVAFYLRLFQRPYTGISKEEVELFQELRDHEMGHRGFLKVLLGQVAIPELTANFDTINFEDRYAVLAAARQIEDMSVAAYNGVGRLMSNSSKGMDYLTHLAKMNVVEARHAATIRELLEPDSFANNAILDPVTHIDSAISPESMLALVDQYFEEDLNADSLPKF